MRRAFIVEFELELPGDTTPEDIAAALNGWLNAPEHGWLDAKDLYGENGCRVFEVKN